MSAGRGKGDAPQLGSAPLADVAPPLTDVLIVTEVRLYRDGLAHALSKSDGVRMRARGVPPAYALAALREEPPDVLLLDATAPNSLEVARTVATQSRRPKIVVLAVSERGDELVPYMEAGASGYVARDGSLEDLVAAVESVARGEMLCSPLVAATLSRRLAALAAATGGGPNEVSLTIREYEVLEQLDRGLSNKQIARALSIEVATVKNHIHNILDKLQVERRGEAAARFRSGQLRAAREEPVTPRGQPSRV